MTDSSNLSDPSEPRPPAEPEFDLGSDEKETLFGRYLRKFLEWIGVQLPLGFRYALEKQFKITMYVEHLFATCTSYEDRLEKVNTPLRQAMARGPGWRNSYMVEQLIVGTFREEKLYLEAKRRVKDAEALGLPTADFYKEELDALSDQGTAAPGNGKTDRLFQLALRLVNDVQWGYLKRAKMRELATVYTQRIYLLFSAVILLFFFTLTKFVEVDRCAAAPTCDTWFAQIGLNLGELEGLTGLDVAVVAGLLGAGLAMVGKSSERVAAASLDDLRTMYRIPYLGARFAIGAASAIILYFIFQAELIGGVVFPKLGDLAFMQIRAKAGEENLLAGYWVPNKDLASLLVWSFLAGFSEALVPAFLGRVESSVSEQKG